MEVCTHGEYQIEEKRQVFDASHSAGNHFVNTHCSLTEIQDRKDRKSVNIVASVVASFEKLFRNNTPVSHTSRAH